MPWHDTGIQIQILGDTNPFSKTGRSSAYRVTVRGQSFLIDCGAPVFSLLSFEQLGELSGVIATHSHDDHRRWLGDLALFRYYVFADAPRLKLYSTGDIHEEYHECSRAALERSLSPSGDRIIDVPYESFIEPVLLGPAPKYRIVTTPISAGPVGGTSHLRVVDSRGHVVGPERAKIVLSTHGTRPRLLFKDPDEGVWVDPVTYYSQFDERFYEPDDHAYVDAENGFTFRALRDHSWHGVPTFGVLFETDRERVLFSSDTRYDPALWRRLVDERPTPTWCGLTREAFDEATVIHGDINDCLERLWSAKRYESATSAYAGTVLLHDTATQRSVVHTDYEFVRDIEAIAKPARLLCVHTPDRFACTERLSFQDKVFRVVEQELYEEVDDELHPLDADVSLKESPNLYHGYRDDAGDWAALERDTGLIDVVRRDAKARYDGRLLFHCRMVQDIAGRHYPRLTDPDERYEVRPDGKVERVRMAADGSVGTVVDPLRRPTKRHAGKDSDSKVRTRTAP